MAIVTSTEMFKKAYAGKYAIELQCEQHGNHSGITEAAKEENAP